CELQLFLPRKVGNMDCTFCLDCVKACPHDNIGILAHPPGSDLMRDPLRSSLGRFSRRADVAALALVVVSSAFVTASAMVAPAMEWRDRLSERFALVSKAPVTSVFFLIGLVPAPALLVSAAVLAGRRLGRIARPARELWCRFSLALAPVG